jgi:ATP-binding cassette, subfamily C (CFTR/MRP), member 1
LKKVHIFPFLKKPSENQSEIEMKVSDGGSNFSLGQRQLLCMARALIRKPKILLMDEATASIDEMTDHLIQDMIRYEFKNTTVITIAHRLNTIIQYDRIMVLDQGKIVEFDTPENLIKNEDSYFGLLIREGGKAFEENMKALAKKKD